MYYEKNMKLIIQNSKNIKGPIFGETFVPTINQMINNINNAKDNIKYLIENAQDKQNNKDLIVYYEIWEIYLYI